MKRPQLISVGSLQRLLRSADEACQRGDFGIGIEILERARRLDPANWKLLLQLGRVHGLNCDYAPAERCFEQAIRLAPDKKEALLRAGRQSLDFPNPQLHRQYFQRASEQPGGSPEALVKLATLHERLHRLNEASELIDRALKLEPNFAPARLARARLERQSGSLEASESALRSLLSEAPRDLQIRGGYELGLVLDRLGRFDEAFAAVLEAKALQRQEAEVACARLLLDRARFQAMQANVSSEMLLRWRDAVPSAPPRRRLALLCGHARSGTTLLEQVLDSHPDIVSVEETEYFARYAYEPLRNGLPENAPILSILDHAPAEALRQSRERYVGFVERFIGQAIGTRLLIDKNPSCNFLIPAFVRVFPEVRFLVAVRDPRDVCLSCFMQAFVPLGLPNCAYGTVERTVDEYAATMGIWRTLAPMLANGWIEVRYEDLVKAPAAVSRRALDFLDVPWNEHVLRHDEHTRQKWVRSPTYADVARPIYNRAVGRWRNYQKYLEPHLAELEPFVKAFGYE